MAEPATPDGRWPPSPPDTTDEDVPRQQARPRTTDEVAVVGMSYQLPSGIGSPQSLWQFCKDKRCAAGPIPQNRFEASHYYHPSPDKTGHFYLNAGSFLTEDIAAFDAPFFNLTEAEATAMDPQHRLMLECAFTAIENAGIDFKDLAGRDDVGVFAAGSKADAELGAILDPHTASRFTVTGNAMTMFANRLSYFFNLRGPSMVVDVACASGLTAIHMAAESIRKGECSCAIVGGAFLQINPLIIAHMANIGALGKDGKSYSYDHRAEGYGRGEGVACIVLKSLRAAEMASDAIRAIIKGSGTNHCGRSQGITFPNGDAQVELIRRVYREAGMSPQNTVVVEGHGTGTAAGDPIEIRSISKAFGGKRSFPLYLGSVKSNFGHLEAASGVLAVIKSVLMLERGEVLPSANFEKLNPATGDKLANLEIPTSCLPWPAGAPRVASVNNFGFGGTNAHLVLQEFIPKVDSAQKGALISYGPKLFHFSARDAVALKDHVSKMAEYVQNVDFPNQDEEESFLERLSYTLCCRRTQMDYQCAVTAGTRQQLVDRLLEPPNPRLKLSVQNTIFCFTGQGAQWATMGMDLMSIPAFRQRMTRADRFLRQELGSTTSLIEEVARSEHTSTINDAVLSQPALTALQLSLVMLLRDYGVKTQAVCGHSSGEIAAAFAAGFLDFNSCMMLAYYRGQVSARDDVQPKGAMLAVGSDAESINDLLEGVTAGSVVVACYNSPTSITVSGDHAGVVELKKKLDEAGIFNRILKVDRAYHSHHMITPGERYLAKITPWFKNTPDIPNDSVIFFSSVSETVLSQQEVHQPEYWVRNLVSPVRFDGAMSNALRQAGKSVTLVEIGPHSALSGPLREISGVQKAVSTKYFSTLLRKEDGYDCMMNLASSMINEGLVLDVSQIATATMTGPPPPILTDLPSYPFNKTRRYPHTSRVLHNLRYETAPWNVMLGHKIPHTINNGLECRNVFTLDDIPWLRDHSVNGSAVFPMAGYLSVVIEAMSLLKGDKHAVSYKLRETVIGKAFRLDEGVHHELFTVLEHKDDGLRGSVGTGWYKFKITSWTQEAGFTEHCTGLVTAICKEDEDVIGDASRKVQWANELRSSFERTTHHDISTAAFYRQTAEAGLRYGPSFQGVTSLATGRNSAFGAVRAVDTAQLMPSEFENPLVIHPTLLDACLQIGLCNTAGNEGHLARMRAFVPTFIEDIMIATDIDHAAGEEVDVYYHDIHHDKMSRSSSADMTVFSHDRQRPVIEIRKIKLVNVSEESAGSSDADAINPQKVEWIDHPEFLDSQRADQIIAAMDEYNEDQENLDVLDGLSLQYMRNALSSVQAIPKEPHLVKFRDWMIETLSHADDSPIPQKIEGSYRDLEWINDVGQRLPEILKEEIHPLSVLQEAGLATIYEESFVFGRSAAIASRILRNLSYQNPSLRILEVGAGTGALTSRLLRELDGCFESFVYTDISKAFLEPAKNKFARWSSKMKFAALDLDLDPQAQGFELGSFDVVIAADVVHATPSISRSLKNIRSLLKPGGALLMLELSRFAPGYFPFAALPGFWGRPGGPVLAETEWRDELRIADFDDSPVITRDWPSGKNMHLIMWCRSKKELGEGEEVVMINGPDLSLDLAVKKENSLETVQNPGCNVICVESMDRPILTETSASTFAALKRLVGSATGIIWVVRSSGVGGMQEPLANLAFGFARAVRLEYTHLKFVVLHLVDADDDTASAAVSQVYRHTFIDFPDESEVEFRWCEGRLQFPRLLTDHRTKDFIDVVANPGRTEKQPFWQQPIHATMHHLGFFDSLHFQPLEYGLADPLGNEEVLIEIRATGVNFKDVLLCLGRVPWQDIGLECSGTVLNIGKDAANSFRKGDRVALYGQGGLFGTHHRCHMDTIVKVPDHLTFSQAASIPLIFCTAYEGLVNVACLQAGEKVLIHAAAGGVGQAAIVLAQLLQAEVYCTVGTPEKRELLKKEYGIPPDRIFSSRTLEFEEGVRLSTGGEGVDVVLNSLAGDLLQASWRCLAAGGRFVEIGKRDALANSPLDMAPFDTAVTFSAVDLALMSQQWPKRASKLLQDVMKLFEKKLLRPVTPITPFSISELVPALRMLQAGKHVGKVIVTNDADAEVQVRASTVTEKDEIRPDASYLITGGTGGLGRSLARWLIDGGARNVVLISRSGRTKNSKLHELLEYAADEKAKVLVEQCDVTKPEQVMAMLERVEQKGMPSVRGIIHGAMYLKVRKE